tara:strand:- start:422 stop:742 length:321 start_codon:yes stop_codon:yes gene_type:complete
LILSKMKQKITLAFATTSLIISNVLDTILTLKWIKFGPLDEANPLMAFLLQGDGCLFAFFKIFVVTILTFCLWFNRHHKISRIFLYILSLFYLALIMWWFLVIFLI